MRFDDGVAFGVERHGADGRPVASRARPSGGVDLACLAVQRVTRGEDRAVFAGVTLSGADVADAAVAIVVVVPTHERCRPGPGRVEISEARLRELRAVLRRSEQRLGVGVLIAYAEAGV